MSTYKGYTQAQNKATQKYQKENYDQLAIRIPKGRREEYKELAEKEEKSLAQLIVDCLDAEKIIFEKEGKSLAQDVLEKQEGVFLAEND